MAGSFRDVRLTGTGQKAKGATTPPRASTSHPNVIPGLLDRFVLVSDGDTEEAGIFRLSMTKPLVLRLELGGSSAGLTLDVNRNDFLNPDGGVDIVPLGPSPTPFMQFQITGKRIGKYILEARKHIDSSNWGGEVIAYAQLDVWFDTEKAAAARSLEYRTKFPPTTANRPACLTPDEWNALLKFTVRFEGPTDFFYNDKGYKGKNQKVTIGVGHAVMTEQDAKDLKGRLVKPDGTKPSEDEAKDDFLAAQGLLRTEKNLWEFATITQLRMPPSEMTDLLTSFMRDKVNTAVHGLSWLSGFSSFPSPAKIACSSISYGDWASPDLQPCIAAIAKHDWATAAQVYRRSFWDASKNYGHMCLFADAAGIPHPPNPF
jgi:hypothetical protein